MTSKIRHSQLDTKGINHIKAIYSKYREQAREISRAIWTMKKFNIPVSNVTVDAMYEKSSFYHKQARIIDEYLCNRLERTVSSDKRVILTEKNNFSDGPVTHKDYEIGFSFMGGGVVEHNKHWSNPSKKVRVARALPAYRYVAKNCQLGIGILKDAQAVQDRHPHKRDESCKETPVVQAHPSHTRSEPMQGGFDGSSPSAPRRAHCRIGI